MIIGIDLFLDFAEHSQHTCAEVLDSSRQLEGASAPPCFDQLHIWALEVWTVAVRLLQDEASQVCQVPQ